MLTIKINDSSSHREKDENGFLIIRSNPIAKAGVFDYLLSEVEPNCDKSKANNIVKVYRDWDMLKGVKDSLANKPIKDNHYWVGDESNTADGAIGSEVTTDDENLYLIADLFIYNPLLINKIERGEAVELSPAYTSEIIKEKGNFNGIDYEYKQNIQCFNHLAVVENGRSGKDLKIQDKGVKMSFKDKMVSAFSKFLDSAEVSDNEAQDNDETKCQDEDKREIIREIMAIASKPDSEFQGGENEKIETIAKIAEKLAYNPSETETSDEGTESEDSDESNTENSSIENAGGETKTINVAELKNEILNEVAEAVSEAVVKAQDGAMKLQKEKEVAYQKVQDSIRAPFDYSSMSISDIYRVGYESLTGSKIQDSLDSKTAFTIASSSISGSVSVQDSKSTSDSLNLSKFK